MRRRPDDLPYRADRIPQAAPTACGSGWSEVSVVLNKYGHKEEAQMPSRTILSYTDCEVLPADGTSCMKAKTVLRSQDQFEGWRETDDSFSPQAGRSSKPHHAS